MSARPLQWLLGGAAMALVVGAVLTLAVLARDIGTQRVIHTLEGNTTAISTALGVRLERALSVGIPMDQLVGVEPMFKDHLASHKEVSFFALLDAGGRPLVFTPSAAMGESERALAQHEFAQQTHSATFNGVFRVVNTPLHDIQTSTKNQGSAGAGWLVTGYPLNYIDQQVNAVVIDLFVAVLIASILILEILRFAGQRLGWNLLLQFRGFALGVQSGNLSARSPLGSDSAWGRMGQAMNRRIEAMRQQAHALATHNPGVARWEQSHHVLAQVIPWRETANLSHLRMLVFLTALSDELVRPFMAVHASQLDGPLALTTEALAGIALTTFLLTWAISQPFGAALLQRHGSRRCLTAATAVVGLSMLATAFSSEWVVLTALRGLTGAGFGFVLIFSQTLMLRLGRESGRAGAIAEFVGAVVAAGICGPVIGGLMSVKLGTTPTLVASGLCALAAWLLAGQLAPMPPAAVQGRPLSWASLAAMLRHRRLLTLLLCSAIPGKLAATAVLLLVVPLAVAEMGESASLTGRLLLLYFLGFWLVSGWAGRLSDKHATRMPFVVAGGLLSALGCWAGFAWDSVWGLVLLCSLLGLGQAWLSSPQIVWATQLADQDPAGTDGEVTLGIYRLLERLGGALGPMLVAGLMASQGLKGALLGVGMALALGSMVTLLTLRGPQPGRQQAPTAAPTPSTSAAD